MNKFFLTLAAGIAIGILIAPAKGSKTRKKLKDGLNGFKDELDNLSNRDDTMLKNAMNTVAEGAVNNAIKIKNYGESISNT
jgi:hypothetical protein